MAELEIQMSAREFSEWQAFWKMNPFGPRIEDLRSGILAATIANFAGKQLREGITKKPADFMLSPEPERIQGTEEQMKVVELIKEAMS